MSRKIKFRAWDKDKKRWTNYSIADDLPRFYDKHSGCWKTDKEYNRFSLMQYTGIKDKNEIEIYEGDIVVSNNGHKYKVIYDDTRFIGVNSIGVCYVDSCYMNGSSRIEVIGNIYENKELLNNE